MINQEVFKIAFPCNYSIRIVGDSSSDFIDVVCNIINKHVINYDGNFHLKKSCTGKYSSIRLSIIATSEKQLKALFKDLKATNRVYIVI